MSLSPFTGRPNPEHAPAYARNYFEQTLCYDHLLDALHDDRTQTHAFLLSLPEEKGDFRYAEGKWSAKEVVGHIIDTERIFADRAFRLSRHDATPLPGFDENDYAPLARAEQRSFRELAAEFDAVRTSAIALFTYMTTEMLDFTGEANGSPLSARSAGWIVIGHGAHHRRILTERYLL